ncbi:unnamed protein product [Didymodactylos carnosus]|uniref:Uncharacterized protein n=1 Tax=Didymodactylos carnosus TaxID=1234261 RepID=A0A815LYM2_9BILA|nr:unnamed protein product [Didymodactylos carnosus]CAF4302419.1 unnamed protein product [Didymodactylos carnosus]
MILALTELIGNLARKGYLKGGKLVRVSNKRVLTSWCKVIPDPTNDDQLKQIVQTLKQDYERTSNLMANHTQLIGALNKITNKNVGNRNKNAIQPNGAGPSGQSQSCSRNKATSPVHAANITRTHVKDQQRTILEPQNTQSS